MTPEDRIGDLDARVHRLKLMDMLDKQKAKAEREDRISRKHEIEAERKTLRVRREVNAYALAEEITDPIKFREVIRAGLLHRFGGEFFVRIAEASKLGYKIVIEE